MFKFVLLFITVSIAGTQAVCNKENKSICLKDLEEEIILRGNKTTICSLAKKIESCLEGFRCIPKRTITFINIANTACERRYSINSTCDFAKLFRCTYKFFERLYEEGNRDLCKQEHSLTRCYTNNKCDAGFERIETRIRNRCGAKVRCNNKTATECLGPLMARNRTGLICSLAKTAVYCLNGVGCDPKTNRILVGLSNICGTSCDLDKLFSCKRALYSKLYKQRKSRCTAVRAQLYCYSNNKCYRLLEAAKRRVKGQCGYGKK